MKERGIGVRELARRANYSPGYISNLRSGNKSASPMAAGKLDSALTGGGRLVEAEEKVAAARASVSRRATPPDAALPSHDELSMAMDTRRDFVILSGSVIAGNILSVAEGELDRLNVALSRGSTHEGRIELLEDMADELGVEVQEAGQATVLNSALSAMSSVSALLGERQPTRYQARLVAVSSKLSTIIGERVFNMGRFRQAREWHKTARYAAHDCGSQYLADISLAQQAFGPIYAGNAAGAISLINPRLEGKPGPSPAVAQLFGVRARAYAATGDAAGFRRSIDRAWDCLDRSSPEAVKPGIFSFRPANLAFYETTAAVSLGDLGVALDAADRALGLFRSEGRTDKGDSVLVGLSRATALAKSGEVREACDTAMAAVTETADSYTLCVRTYAQAFSAEIRADASPEAREWRDALAEVEAARD
jgi:hypothetical protein